MLNDSRASSDLDTNPTSAQRLFVTKDRKEYGTFRTFIASESSASSSQVSPNDDRMPEDLDKHAREESSGSLWERLNPRLTLENAGNVARDHLALERTFMAYVRTSLAISMCGVVLVQLFSITSRRLPIDKKPVDVGALNIARIVGVLAILTGLAVLVIGVTRYFIVQSGLVKGLFKPANVSITFISVSLSGLAALVFAITLVEIPAVRSR